MQINQQIQSILSLVLPEYSLMEARSLAGGSMSEIFELYFAAHKPLIIKIHNNPPKGYFRGEKTGLESMQKVIKAVEAMDYLRVPHVLAHAENFIILEKIDSRTSGKSQSAVFGLGLAKMHLASSVGFTENKFGFSLDTFCGLTRQPNAWSENWQDFFWQNRILMQTQLLQENGLLQPAVKVRLEKFRKIFNELIPVNPKPALLHGDLWSGNVLYSGGKTVLIDPAVYFGHNEADLAFTTLFGSQPESFYHAYQKHFPWEFGWQDRFLIYNLYHLLNHANLFHSHSYLNQALEILIHFKC